MEPSSGCAAVGDVGVVELLSRCVAVAVAVGTVGVDVGVALDDHYHRSINGRPISRQNESVCISGDKTLGDKTLDQIPRQRPLHLTPTARTGCGLYSLVCWKKK